MNRTLPILLCLIVALAGCKAKEVAEKTAIANDLEKRGTAELLEEIQNDKYTPPADGRLTDSQVEMYLKVREQEKKIAEVAKEQLKEQSAKIEKAGEKSLAGMMEGFKALGSAADFLTADIRAAKDLGFNTQEYLWVKQQILAASTSAMAEKFSQATDANFEKAYAEAKKARDEAKDEATKKLYSDMLASYDQSRQELAQGREADDPAAAFNRQLLTKYERALNAWAHEMSKYEDKAGEVDKSVQEMEQNLDQAIDDAKKQ
ncbi:MAG: hypothetical protein WA208_19355 [Thermoanaerobaculia bacterium]